MHVPVSTITHSTLLFNAIHIKYEELILTVKLTLTVNFLFKHAQGISFCINYLQTFLTDSDGAGQMRREVGQVILKISKPLHSCQSFIHQSVLTF